MKKENKTHYRKVFKSDHLGVADLEDFIEEGKRLVFEIKEVRQEFGVAVAGRKGDFNIAYFKENIKPLVLNAVNSKMIKKFTSSSFIEDWKNVLIELYADNSVKMKGEIVGGVRIKPTQPTRNKPQLDPSHIKWEDAKKSAKNGKIEAIKKHYSLSAENEKLLLS